MPSTEERGARTLLRDRDQWVRMRTELQHTFQAIAINHPLRQGRALWSAAGQTALEALHLPIYKVRPGGKQNRGATGWPFNSNRTCHVPRKPDILIC